MENSVDNYFSWIMKMYSQNGITLILMKSFVARVNGVQRKLQYKCMANRSYAFIRNVLFIFEKKNLWLRTLALDIAWA